MEDKRNKRSPKVSLPQPPPPPVNPHKLSVLPSSKSATFSLGLPQPPSPKNRGKLKRSIGAAGQSKDVVVAAPPKTTRFGTVTMSNFTGKVCSFEQLEHELSEDQRKCASDHNLEHLLCNVSA
ncbi:unnamed protein product [Coregonus sp. 'balchen']|nr:unnamed protein product [Coregonus sp. 'balchen']